MPEASLVDVMRNAIRGQYDAVLTEPLPQPWLDLLARLERLPSAPFPPATTM
jgi:hypothetical protein